MNKQESQNLMIGSWVLAGGEPRQVSSLTTKKAGFKRGTSGHRDFFVFGQLQSISLSEGLLKECVCVNPPKVLVPEYMTVEFLHNTVVIKERNENVDYLLFPNLHTMQAFFLSRYGCTINFDVEKFKFLMQPEMVVTTKELNQLKEVAADRIPYESPNVVLGPSLVERLRGIWTRHCACNPSISGIPDLGKDERGLQKGMLTYED